MAKQALAAKVQTRNDREDQNSDGPLIDTINIAVKNLIKKGKDRGFLTFGEVNAAFSQTQLKLKRGRETIEIKISIVERPFFNY